MADKEPAMTPKVAVAVFVIRDEKKVLLGRRRSAAGSSTFALPGGKLEFGETLKDCAARETKEETNVDITEAELLTVTDDIRTDADHHYVTVIMRATPATGSPEAENMEPDKCEGWDWYDWDSLPTPLFPALEKMVRSGFNPLPLPLALPLPLRS